MPYMKLFTSGALAVLLPLVSAANPFCKGGAPAVVASVLTDFPPAVTFCSSAFPLPKISSTKTAPTTTVTTTVATLSPLTTVATVTDTLSNPGPPLKQAAHVVRITPTTETVTVTSATQTDSTTITAATTTFTDTATTTTTSTSTVFTISIIQKRDTDNLVGRSNPKASAQWVSVQKQAKSFIGTICTCLQTPVTVYATTTPSTTVSATATSPVKVTATSTATVTATSTVSATATITTTFSITASTTTTTTSTSTVVTTVTQAVAYRGPICNNPDMVTRGIGGCSANCYCDPRVPGGQAYGVCDTDTNCNAPTCSSDADCGPGRACANYGCPAPQCVDYSACSSSFVPTPAKRGLELFSRRVSPLERRQGKTKWEKLMDCRHKGIRTEDCEV